MLYMILVFSECYNDVFSYAVCAVIVQALDVHAYRTLLPLLYHLSKINSK